MPMKYNNYQDNIAVLQNKGQVIAHESHPQPHSKITVMDCGCMINSELSLATANASPMNKRFVEAGFRQWICPCRTHASDKDLFEK